jgi:hypothetical protein
MPRAHGFLMSSRRLSVKRYFRHRATFGCAKTVDSVHSLAHYSGVRGHLLYPSARGWGFGHACVSICGDGRQGGLGRA